MKSKKICDKIKSILSDKSYVLAIFHNGSFVVGTDTPQSDVDFTVVVKTRQDIEKAIRLLKRETKFIGIDHDVNFYSVVLEPKKRVGVCIFDKKTMNSFVNNLHRSKKDFLKLQSVIQHKIVEAIQIYDPQNLLEKYQKKVSLYPKSTKEAVFSDSIKSLKILYNEWRRDGFRNEFQFTHEIPSVMEKICLALYSKNRKLFMLPYKRLHKDLKELKPNIEKEMSFLVMEPNNRKNIDKKIQTLKRIIDKLSK